MPHTRCPGSQEYRDYSPAQVTRISQTGRNAAARVTCTQCGRTFTVDRYTLATLVAKIIDTAIEQGEEEK